MRQASQNLPPKCSRGSRAARISWLAIAAFSLLACASSGQRSGLTSPASNADGEAVFWIDTDLGLDVDDFMALVVAGQHLGPRWVGASTTLYHPQTKARLTRLILDELGLCHVPAYAGLGIGPGEEQLFAARYPGWPHQFGAPRVRLVPTFEAVFGGPRVAALRAGSDAVAALIATIHRYKGRIVLVALGPLTNIAAALRQDPTIARKIRRLVVMGGWRLNDDGSVQRPSYNTAMDLDAARFVFNRSDLRLLLVNSQTLQAAGMRLRAEDYRRLKDTPARTLVGTALVRDMQAWANEIGNAAGTLALADPVTLLVAMDPARWAARVTSVQVQLRSLPGVHLKHPRAGELVRLNTGSGPRLRVVQAFRDDERLRQTVVDALVARLRHAPTIRCRRSSGARRSSPASAFGPEHATHPDGAATPQAMSPNTS